MVDFVSSNKVVRYASVALAVQVFIQHEAEEPHVYLFWRAVNPRGDLS